MKIEIKNLLLEGYSPEEITEGIIGRTLGGAALAAGLTLPNALYKDFDYAKNVSPQAVEQINSTFERNKPLPSTVYGKDNINKYYQQQEDYSNNLPKVKDGNNYVYHHQLVEKYRDNGNNPMTRKEALSAAASQLGSDTLDTAAKAGLLGATLGALGANGRRKVLNSTGRVIRRVGTFIEKSNQSKQNN